MAERKRERNINALRMDLLNQAVLGNFRLIQTSSLIPFVTSCLLVPIVEIDSFTTRFPCRLTLNELFVLFTLCIVRTLYEDERRFQLACCDCITDHKHRNKTCTSAGTTFHLIQSAKLTLRAIAV